MIFILVPDDWIKNQYFLIRYNFLPDRIGRLTGKIVE